MCGQNEDGSVASSSNTPGLTRRHLMLFAGAAVGVALVSDLNFPKSSAMAAGTYLRPCGSVPISDSWQGHKDRNPSSGEPGTDYSVASGTAVYAAASGVIADRKDTTSTATGRYLALKADDGNYIRYLHLKSSAVAVGQRVNRGDLIARSGASGFGSDSGYGAHVHVSLWIGGTPAQLGYANTVDFENYVGDSTTPPIPTTDRSFSISAGGVLQGKMGMYEPVVDLRTNIVAVDAHGTTVAAVDGSGVVWVQQGPFSSGWVSLADGAKDVAVDGERFVVLKTDGTVIAKEGLYSTTWTTQLTGVSQIDADAGRIGVLANGILYVKEGNLWASWTNQSTDVSHFALNGTRIGIVSGGTAYVKEGNLYTSWVPMRAGTKIKLEGTRVGVLTPEGIVTVKEDNLWSSWSNLSEPGVTDFDMSGTRVGVVQSDGSLIIKTGPLNASWVGAYANSRAVTLS